MTLFRAALRTHLAGAFLAAALLTASAARADDPCAYRAAPRIEFKAGVDVATGLAVSGYAWNLNCQVPSCDHATIYAYYSHPGVTFPADPGAGTPIDRCVECFDSSPDARLIHTTGEGTFPVGHLVGTRFVLQFTGGCGNPARNEDVSTVQSDVISTKPIVPDQAALCSFTRPEDIDRYDSSTVSCDHIPLNTPVRVQARFLATPRGSERLRVHVEGGGVVWQKDYGYDEAKDREAGLQFFEDTAAVFTFTRRETVHVWIGFNELRADREILLGLDNVTAATSTTGTSGADGSSTGGSCGSVSGASLLPLAFGTLALLRRRRSL